jgi:predicted Zn-dependent protease
MIDGNDVFTLLEDAIRRGAADETEIVTEVQHGGITRYAGSTIHQTSVLDTVRVWVQAAVGSSLGAAVGDSLAPADLDRLIADATAVARAGEAHRDFQHFADPEPLPTVAGYDDATEMLSSAGRAAAIGEIVARVADRGWTASGTYLVEGRHRTVVNSRGVRAQASSSTAFLRALPDSGTGTGYADALTSHAATIDPAAVAEEAIARCARNLDQRDLQPGAYEAIFSDLCVAETLFYLAGHTFGGRPVEEGRSFISGHLGDRVTSEHVTIWDDATDGRGLAVAADYEGVPARPVMLLERGVARGAVYDTITAQRAGRSSTGHATDPDRSDSGPIPANLFMAGGDATLEEMIRATDRGLLLTRFHYTHCPDPQRVVMTGTTRDGTFLIEDGEIVGAVKNLRLTQSIPELYDGIELLGTPRLCRDWWCSNGMGTLSYVCPPIKVARATFDSGTRF